MSVIVFCVWICSLKYHKALKRFKLMPKSLLHFLYHKKHMFANVCFANENEKACISVRWYAIHEI